MLSEAIMKKDDFYKMLYPKHIYFLASAVILIALSAIVLNILKLFVAAGLSPYNPFIDTISIVLGSAIILIVLYSVIFTGFSFRADKLVFRLSIFTVNIPYENMLLLRRDKKSDMMLLYYNLPVKDKEENIKYLIVNLKKDDIDNFIDRVKGGNRRVIYELFDKEKEEKDNNA
jgi:hypothetical protein